MARRMGATKRVAVQGAGHTATPSLPSSACTWGDEPSVRESDSFYRTYRDLQPASLVLVGSFGDMMPARVNLLQGLLSSTAGGRGSFRAEGLPLADLFGQLTLLAFVCCIFPPTSKLVESALHKSDSSRFAFWFVAVTVS